VIKPSSFACDKHNDYGHYNFCHAPVCLCCDMTYREVSVPEPTIVIYSQLSLPQLKDNSSVSEPHSSNVNVSEPLNL